MLDSPYTTHADLGSRQHIAEQMVFGDHLGGHQSGEEQGADRSVVQKVGSVG